jgi:hypothetical protein
MKADSKLPGMCNLQGLQTFTNQILVTTHPAATILVEQFRWCQGFSKEAGSKAPEAVARGFVF